MGISVLEKLSLKCLLNTQVEMSSRQLTIGVWSSGKWAELEKGRGLKTDLGGTVTFESGEEEKSIRETGRERKGRWEECM